MKDRIVHFSITGTTEGVSFQKHYYQILSVNPKTLKLKSLDPKRDYVVTVKKSKIETNISIMKQDLLDKFHYSTWVYPDRLKFIRSKILHETLEEFFARRADTETILDHLKALV